MKDSKEVSPYQLALHETIKNFYNKVSRRSNVLSCEQVYENSEKASSIFKRNIWYKKFNFLKYRAREEYAYGFGLESGVLIFKDYAHFIYGSESHHHMDIEVHLLKTHLVINDGWAEYKFDDYLKSGKKTRLSDADISTLQQFIKELAEFDANYIKQIEAENQQETLLVEENRKELIAKFEAGSQGQLKISQNAFSELLHNYESELSVKAAEQISNLVRLNKFLDNIREDIIDYYGNIYTLSNKKDLAEFAELIRGNVERFDNLLFHATSMIVALLESRKVAYQEIYEMFDRHGVFNSAWQNSVDSNLSSIDRNLSRLNRTMSRFETNLISEMQNLRYTTQAGFDDLKQSVGSRLEKIKSAVDINTLFSAVQAYQTYKVRKEISNS